MSNIIEKYNNFILEYDEFAGLEVHRSLNDRIWDRKNGMLQAEISERLMEIAQDFLDSSEVTDVEIKDVTFTGSLANYNYSQHSDVDLHIVVDFTDIDENIELVKEYFDTKKALWNLKHMIMIHGYEVEIYVQDDQEPHTSSGVYSIMNNDWIKKPTPRDPEFDYDNIKKKAEDFKRQISQITKLQSEQKYEEAMSLADKLKQKIRKFRQAGLEDQGEYSVENLTFKVLRRTGYLDMLSGSKDSSYDQMMSIDETKYGMDSDWLKEDSMEDVFKYWNGFLNEGWAGSSFGGTLNPPVYGEKPGAAYAAVQQGEQLQGWDKYMQLVAEAYAAAPDSTPEGEKAFKALKGHIDNNFDRLESRVKVKFVDGQPYENAEEMKDRVGEDGVLQISRDFNQSGFFGAKRNLKFRAIHDWYAHMKATTKSGVSMMQFGLKGELQAYNAHLNFIGANAEALPAIFTEVVGQVCHQSYFGEFPEQKVVALPQFDPKRIGSVEGYEIIERELQPKDEMGQLKEYFYSFLPMVQFDDRTYSEVEPPSLPVDEVLQAWVYDDLKVYDELLRTGDVRYHVRLPTKEICKAMKVDTELGYPGSQPERVRRRRRVVEEGEIYQPVVIAVGKNGRAVLLNGKKDLLAAFDAGLKEVPVVFEYHRVV